MNWRGEPLVNFETVINLISSTITKNGLGIKALLDTEEYETGKKLSDDQMKKINLTFHQTNPKWNYTITPKKTQGNIKK